MSKIRHATQVYNREIMPVFSNHYLLLLLFLFIYSQLNTSRLNWVNDFRVDGNRDVIQLSIPLSCKSDHLRKKQRVRIVLTI